MAKYAIDPVTGIVTVVGPLEAGFDNIAIVASGTVPGAEPASFSIHVTTLPQISFTPPTNLFDDATIGAAVGTATLSGDFTGTPVWSLSNNAGGKYAINPSTGAVTVAATLTAGNDSITIAVSGITPAANPAPPFSITVHGSPGIDFTPATMTESAVIGSLVGTATLHGSFTGTANWTLVDNAGGKYAINPSTGAVTVAATLEAGTDNLEIAVSGVTPSAPNDISSVTVNPPALSDFTFEAETIAYTNAFNAPPSEARKITLNRLIKTLKDAGVWSKIVNGGKGAAWLIGKNEDEWMKDITGNGFTMTKVGSPTFTSNVDVNGSNTSYYDTHWNPAAVGINVNDFHVSCFSRSISSTSANELGLISTNGIALNLQTSTVRANAISYRLNGVNVTGNAQLSDGEGHVVASLSGTVAKIYRNGELVEQNNSYTPAAAVNLNLHILRVNGATSSSGRHLSFVSVGAAVFTDAEAKAFYAALRTALNAIQYGDLNTHDPALNPQNISADVVVYGATSQGCVAAYSAKRAGKSVVIVGGWRERRIGGMSTGGIGNTDIDDGASIGGLPRLLITRVNAIYARADTTLTFEPRIFDQALRGLLDPARTDGLDIPIYWSTGVVSVKKTGTKITQLRTRDNRFFTGEQFIDASYEGDLFAAAGCSFYIGREAAGSGKEGINGWRGTSSSSNGLNLQFASPPVTGTFYNIDPYVVAGNAGSGLLPGVMVDPGLGIGAADTRLQAYNFRLNLCLVNFRKSNALVAKPAGWSITTYEPLLRFLAALTADGKVYGVDYSFATTELWSRQTAGSSPYLIFDINNAGGMGTDYLGQNWNYPTASYDDRETIWQTHWKYIQGLLYLYQSGRTVEGETRIPADLETGARGYGFDRLAYNDPYPGDDYWVPAQLYVREARRLVGDYIHDANDLCATDGTTPRSIKTIGCASYALDSHHVMMMADVAHVPPRIWNTGGFQDIASGGADNLSPLPFEIVLPKVSECTNLQVPFAVSATHAAFAAIRMEMAAMTMAQATGLAASLAIDGSVNVQDVNYTTLRTALLASNTLSGELPPVLPQVN